MRVLCVHLLKNRSWEIIRFSSAAYENCPDRIEWSLWTDKYWCCAKKWWSTHSLVFFIVSKEFFFAPNKRFLEQYVLKPVVVKNEDSNKSRVKDSSNQTVAAKESDNQTSQDAEIFIEELATPPDDQRIFRFQRAYVNQQLANLNALLNDARVIPIEQDGKPWFIFDFVREGSIYEKLGLKKKDVIVKINGFTVDSLPKALKLFEALQLEEKITLRIKREGQLTDFQYFIDG